MTGRSGIEILVDQACGFTQKDAEALRVKEASDKETLEPETSALLRLADSAKAWWETFRPEVYSELEHIGNPTVNHLDAVRDMDLCSAVANWVALGG